MQSANDIRKTFLDFFADAGHEIVASGPLVPHNDPTLLFTNAGMVQFKNVFTGAEKRDYARAVTSQKCLRAGGKHNDLDNVGYTARHHTFFEMLGNFSFGDYFKENAIELAWNLLTREYGLNPDRMLVTVYHDDDVAFDLWKKITGFADERIIRIATSDNFWSMGETGPCGPCSEIFYDHGDHIPGGPPGSPNEDGDRFIEIWNLVFMQYEQISADERIELPKPSIDTGMGLERLAALLQGKHDNYDTDIMQALIGASAEASGRTIEGDHAVSHRVIADHLRAVSFLMADGVLPSNEGRGYVLRRIMRRAMRHAHLLGCKDPMMWRLVPALVKEMGQAFGELVRAEALITETLKLEEKRFKQTLERGLHLLDDEVDQLSEGQALPGDVAFKLYDTYGFPLDLTQDAMRTQGREVDTAGFDAAMERQREDARAAWKGSGDAATEELWFELHEGLGATEFLGYETEVAEGRVKALIVDGNQVQTMEAKTEPNIVTIDGKRGEPRIVPVEAQILVNQTPFYAESGGQVGDSGLMISADGAEIAVKDTAKKLGLLHVHECMVKGKLSVDDDVELRVEGGRRSRIRANHSATHLLHEALRRRLGDHVTQKGSLVSADRLRFDVSQPTPLSDEDVSVVEAEVNERIRENSAIGTVLMSPDEAVEAGAMALFGEKYGDEVRVVSMGGSDGKDTTYSVELCGGTHVSRAGDIGLFKIVNEGAVAAGVRRIEALTGAAANTYVNEQVALVRQASAALKAAPAELVERITALSEERRKLERELSDVRRELATGGGAGGGVETKDIGGITFAGKSLDGVPPKDLKAMVDEFKSQAPGVYALIALNDGKASIVVGVTDDLTDKFNAVDLVRVGVAELGGKGGGGRPDMAQGGGPDATASEAALAAIEGVLAG